MRRFLLSALCLPMNLLGFVLVALATLGSQPSWHRRARVLIVRPASASWLARRWLYSTTLGHVILWHPDHDEGVLEHELVHVLQAEACCLGWWLITLVAWSTPLALLSPFAWLAIYGASCVAAWLGGAEAYRGNVFERHARAEVLATLMLLTLAVSACARPPASPLLAPSNTGAAATASTDRVTPPPRAIERVVVLSIDGLRPSDCARLPTLGALARDGAFAAPPEGALSVMPTVTYPAHTSIATGVNPARHGITTNLASDPTPDRKNKSGWRWYREDVRVATLYELAFDAGLKTALINWPVTVGARATALLPEYWHAGTPEDLKLVRLLASPGLFDEVTRRYPNFAQAFTPPEVRDEVTIDVALTLLETVQPQLMMLHIWQTDAKQHEFGPDTPEADLALRHADTQVARLLSALQRSEVWPRTVLVVVSDHGFSRIDKLVAPLVHLARAGLSERVWIDTTGASAYLYAQPGGDAGLEATLRTLFEKLAQDPASGIASVMDKQAIRALGGDPDAILAIEALPGFAMARETTGQPVIAAVKKGVHGYLPTRPEMRATLLFYGPAIAPSMLSAARLIDVAPTIAPWLGLTLSDAEGQALPITLRKSAATTP